MQVYVNTNSKIKLQDASTAAKFTLLVKTLCVRAPTGLTDQFANAQTNKRATKQAATLAASLQTTHVVRTSSALRLQPSFSQRCSCCTWALTALNTGAVICLHHFHTLRTSSSLAQSDLTRCCYCAQQRLARPTPSTRVSARTHLSHCAVVTPPGAVSHLPRTRPDARLDARLTAMAHVPTACPARHVTGERAATRRTQRTTQCATQAVNARWRWRL